MERGVSFFNNGKQLWQRFRVNSLEKSVILETSHVLTGPYCEPLQSLAAMAASNSDLVEKWANVGAIVGLLLGDADGSWLGVAEGNTEGASDKHGKWLQDNHVLS